LKSSHIVDKICPILAFIFPLLIRSIPEILAWPWPIGFDTIFSYVPWIMNGYPLNLDLMNMLKGTRLFPLLALAMNFLINDPILTVKVLGSILYAILGLCIYLFARMVLTWHPRKSLFLVLISSIYFVSLRISWEMYRQMLGTIFLLLTLTARHASKPKAIPLTIVFSIFTVLSHEIAAVILLAILFMEGVRCILRRDLERLPLTLYSFLPVSIIFAYMLYDPRTRFIKLPLESLEGDWFMLARFITGFLIYCYAFLLPIAAYGALKLRNGFVHYWAASTLAIGLLWPLLYPQASPPLWFRWIIFMVYPMSIYFTEGAHRVLASNKDAPKPVKISAIILITFIILSAGYYLVAPPEKAFPYFSDYNPYKAYIESSMLQSTIPISDIDDVMASLDWIAENSGGGCVLILHEAFYPWSLLRDGVKCRVVLVRERNLSKPIRETFADKLTEISEKFADNGKTVYTIWWVEGKGWYNVPSLPKSFKRLASYGDIAVYTYISQ